MSDNHSNFDPSNPYLLNPMNTGQQQVPQAPSFAGMTRAFPVTLRKDPKYYHCTMLNHHMHRSDGKRLAFIFGICETRDEYDIQYLDYEIANNNPFILPATSQQIAIYQMRVDPRGTMIREVTPEIEARVKQELEIELKNSIREKMNTVGITLTDEQKEVLMRIMGGDSVENTDPVEENVGPATPTMTDAEKLARTDALNKLRGDFGGALSSGKDKVILTSSQQASLQQSSIVGSDRTTAGVATKKD
jgi:hypothetical protein